MYIAGMFKLILTFLISLALMGCSDATSNYHGKGTMKKWVQEQAQAAGLELRWNMNIDYDIAELHKQELKGFPLWQTVELLRMNMTLNNLNKQLRWPINHAGQQYPYPIMVVTAVCKKTLVFAEVPDLNIYTKNLIEGKYEGCIPVDRNLGLKIVSTSTNTTSPLFPFATPPLIGASETSQLSVPSGQFKSPIIGSSEIKVPQIEPPKK